MKFWTNSFWLTRGLSDRTVVYELHNHIPHRYRDEITGLKYWVSKGYHCFLGKQSIEKFLDITSDTEPIHVQLVPTDSKTPDFYVQRYNDCLFIGNRLETHFSPKRRKLFGWKYIKEQRVAHNYMISNKLFPEITEESGIVKFNIERI